MAAAEERQQERALHAILTSDRCADGASAFCADLRRRYRDSRLSLQRFLRLNLVCGSLVLALLPCALRAVPPAGLPYARGAVCVLALTIAASRGSGLMPLSLVLGGAFGLLVTPAARPGLLLCASLGALSCGVDGVFPHGVVRRGIEPLRLLLCVCAAAANAALATSRPSPALLGFLLAAGHAGAIVLGLALARIGTARARRALEASAAFLGSAACAAVAVDAPRRR